MFESKARGMRGQLLCHILNTHLKEFQALSFWVLWNLTGYEEEIIKIFLWDLRNLRAVCNELGCSRELETCCWVPVACVAHNAGASSMLNPTNLNCWNIFNNFSLQLNLSIDKKSNFFPLNLEQEKLKVLINSRENFLIMNFLLKRILRNFSSTCKVFANNLYAFSLFLAGETFLFVYVSSWWSSLRI